MIIAVSNADKMMRKDLLQEAKLFAEAIDINRLKAFKGDQSDLQNPDYLRLKQQLATFKAANPSYSFVYLLGQHIDGRLFFIIDNEPIDSKDYSPPGQLYTDVSEEDLSVIRSRSAKVTGPSKDQWGVWVSALIPIVNSQDGEPLATLGMDVAATHWQASILRAAGPPLLLTLSLCITILLGAWLLRRRRRLELSIHLNQFLEGYIIAAIGLCVTCYLSFLFHGNELEKRKEIFEPLAQSASGAIANFLNMIQKSEIEGLAEFYEASETVTKEEFHLYSTHLVKNTTVESWNWIAEVTEEQRSEFEQTLRQNDSPTFEIWERTNKQARRPATHRPMHYPIVLQAAPLVKDDILGFNLSAIPEHSTAIEHAKMDRLMTASPPVELNDITTQQGLFVFRPVFAPEAKEKLRGLILVIIRLQNLMRASTPNPNLIHELAFVEPDGNSRVVASSQQNYRDPSFVIRDSLTERHLSTRPLFIFNQTYTIKTYSSPDFDYTYPITTNWVAGIIGILLTAALTIIISSVSQRRFILEREVKQRTLLIERQQIQLENMSLQGKIGAWEIDVVSGEVHWSNVTKIIHELIDTSHLTLQNTMEFFKEGESRKKITAVVTAAISDGIAWQEDLELITARGNAVWVTSIGQAEFKDGSCIRIYGSIQDISERKQNEKLKSEFVSTVSHELRTPLTSITGALGLLANGLLGEIPDKAKRPLEIALQNSKRLGRLINDLLDVEKLTAGKMHFDIHVQSITPLVQQAIESNRNYGADRNIKIDLAAEDGDIAVAVDSLRLIQVLSNLLSNAIKYSPDNDVVAVRVEQKGKTVSISVRDKGKGIPLAFRNRIFQKFSQADSSDTRQKGGTGLGLAISQELITRMEGKIDFTSTENQGTCFFIDLPIVEHLK